MRKVCLLPKEPKFFALFEQQASNIVNMARQLKDMIEIWYNLKERAAIMADMEHEGDAITHNIMKLLNRTFVTPFEREDITALASSLDDIADLIHSTADTLYRYKIENPTEKARELGNIILEAATELAGGVSELKIHICQPELYKKCIKINEIENTGDVVYRAALAELFADPSDMALIVKWREIYKNMEMTLDACEECADILESIAIKSS